MSEREIKIGFGTLFEVAEIEDRTDVIINVGEGDSFESARVGETEEGKRWLSYSGTSLRSDIKRIVGQMSPEEVIEAAKQGAMLVENRELS
ncbi:MAG: hypothetical protein NTV24_01690, partial [Candidatus Woesebacteria bacterium]|nr:hypothetical protein [Candidatus Woesebacteria bacterium]